MSSTRLCVTLCWVARQRGVTVRSPATLSGAQSGCWVLSLTPWPWRVSLLTLTFSIKASQTVSPCSGWCDLFFFLFCFLKVFNASRLRQFNCREQFCCSFMLVKNMKLKKLNKLVKFSVKVDHLNLRNIISFICLTAKVPYEVFRSNYTQGRESRQQ